MITLLTGDCREQMGTLPAGSVQTCVTSPPYYGLRKYGDDVREIGQEATPAAYVAALVAVFEEVKRVLRDDGTCWVNLGDSYAMNGIPGLRASGDHPRDCECSYCTKPNTPRRAPAGIPPKNLLGMPWRVAFALQDAGWILRSDIIWSKPNPMPESVRDRPTRAHEYLFLFAKRPRYFYDADAIREPHKAASLARYEYGLNVSAPADGKISAGANNPRAMGHTERLG
ncbi:MAG TPA: site-specific DNA-methyltransferase, partial [Burkholderiales bacterium]|nr:site-specific DNA-methyltransferase [Burkholderiales bacterium]